MPEFIARIVTVLDFSNPLNIQLPDIYQPQSCIIKLENKTIDIGSHCYTIRNINKKGIAQNVIKNKQGIYVIPVSLNSLDYDRIALIRTAIIYAANYAVSLSQSTLYNTIRRILSFQQFYFSQSDLNYSTPENRSDYEEAALRYSAILKANEKTGAAIKHSLSNVVFKFAEFLFDGTDLNTFDYDIIPTTNQNKKGTPPLLADEYELALALRTAIFEGIVDLLVNNQTLPYALKVPEACGDLNNTIWLGYKPWGGVCIFPRKNDFEKYQPKEWFDRDKGLLATKEHWLKRTDHKNTRYASDTWRTIQKRLKSNNSDHSNLKRILSDYANLCFFDLLISMTGINQQPALDLPWYGGYFIQKAKQGNKIITLLKHEDQAELEQVEAPNIYLRSIKNRKGYEPVEVAITNRFLPQFELYLQLRNYYLNGNTDARLFPFSARLINQKRQSLHYTFPETPKLGARKSRATVSDNILTTTNDPHVAAQILQNDPKTVIKHYAAGTQKNHIQGMGGFFNALGNQIKISRKASKNEIETAVGNCKNGGAQPDPLPSSPIDSNCTQQEGCFFCKHFCVHADETDIRKLFSVLYYINKGATRAHDVDLFNELFELVIKRIEELLKKIEAISAEKKALVARIKNEVLNHEALDDYWLCKLNRLEILTGDY